MATFCFMRQRSPFFEIAFLLVRFDHVASPHRKHESRRNVSGCKTRRIRLHDALLNTAGDGTAAHLK